MYVSILSRQVNLFPMWAKYKLFNLCCDVDKVSVDRIIDLEATPEIFGLISEWAKKLGNQNSANTICSVKVSYGTDISIYIHKSNLV